MKEWMTPAEIAALQLAGMPSERASMSRWASRHGWQTNDSKQARKRAGRGGGWEYHVSLLPEVARADWRRRREATLPAVPEPKPVRPAEDISQLDGRRRRIMEARGSVLGDIRRRQYADGVSQRQAILSLISDYRGDTQTPEDRRVLPHWLFEACHRSTEKGYLISERSVYDWVDAEAKGGIGALAPKPKRPKAADGAFDALLPPLLRFYCRPQKPSLHEARRQLIESGLMATEPSYAQCKRAIGSLRGTDRTLDLHRGREGRLKLKSRLGFVRRDTSGLEPCDIFTADGHTFKAEVRHPAHGRPFRPEITSILDVATRRCVGWSVGLAETAEGVADALRTAAEHHGIPAIFYSDRGPGYRAARFDAPVAGLCSRLGITPTHSLPYNSQSRGIIERFQQTWHELARTFPTYMGDRMDREARQGAFRQTRQELREVGGSATLPSWEAFVEAADAMVAAYNARPHSALRERDRSTGTWIERSPDQAWSAAVEAGAMPFALGAGEADDLFRPVVERQVSRGEVQFNTNIYFDDALEPFDGLKVFVGYDIHDASRVWVRKRAELDGETVVGGLICIAAYGGNTQHYMPRPMVETARERRRSGRLARVEARREEIEAEAIRPLIEDAPAEVELRPHLEVVGGLDAAPQPARRSSFEIHEDVILASDVLAGTVELTSGRWKLLADFVGHRAGQELLDHGGVDPEALRAHLRANRP